MYYWEYFLLIMKLTKQKVYTMGDYFGIQSITHTIVMTFYIFPLETLDNVG